MDLNPKQLKFCQEYILDFNATQAAIRGGYSQKTAASQACRLLINVNISAKVEELTKKTAAKAQVSIEQVLRDLHRIATADVGKAYDEDGNLLCIHDIPEDVRLCISSIESVEEFQGKGAARECIGYIKKLKFWDKSKALELLGKHLQIFVDNVRLDHRSDDKSMSPQPALTLANIQSDPKLFNDLMDLNERIKAAQLTTH